MGEWKKINELIIYKVIHKDKKGNIIKKYEINSNKFDSLFCVKIDKKRDEEIIIKKCLGENFKREIRLWYEGVKIVDILLGIRNIEEKYKVIMIGFRYYRKNDEKNKGIIEKYFFDNYNPSGYLKKIGINIIKYKKWPENIITIDNKIEKLFMEFEKEKPGIRLEKYLKYFKTKSPQI